MSCERNSTLSSFSVLAEVITTQLLSDGVDAAPQVFPKASFEVFSYLKLRY